MTTKTNIPRPIATALCVAGVLGASGAMTACRGDRTDKSPRQFLPDMDEQPKFKAQGQTPFFEDGKSQRPLVDRTVPWGSTVHDPEAVAHADWAQFVRDDRDRMLKADQTFSFGLVAGSTADQPKYAEYMPVPVTEKLILRGQERFDIYCSMCHGYTGVGGQGEGAGTVGKLWSYAPANLTDPKYQDRKGELGSDGYIFHVIRQGLWKPDGGNRMPAYGHVITEADAWAIVAYVRTLQAAHSTPVDTLDPADRARLDATGGNP